MQCAFDRAAGLLDSPPAILYRGAHAADRARGHSRAVSLSSCDRGEDGGELTERAADNRLHRNSRHRRVSTSFVRARA
jgi:hypothetical protein